MRGPDEQTSHMFSYVVPEQRVRQDHPPTAIRLMTDGVFRRCPRDSIGYTHGPAIDPAGAVAGALLLQSLNAIRSDRLR